MPRGSALHAKVTIILFEGAVRLIVGSANLTERGYRRNREVVSILTATQGSRKDATIISQALVGATQVLNPWLTSSARALLADSLDTLRPWVNGNGDPNTVFLWTHGQTKLWREFLDRWPSEDTIKRLEKAGDWNRYEVRCDERHIQIWLNGEKTVDYIEPDTTIPQRGLIGLQMHGGNKAEVSFRNITIQEL